MVGEHTLKNENETLKKKIRSAENEIRSMVARINFLEGKLIDKTKNGKFFSSQLFNVEIDRNKKLYCNISFLWYGSSE